MRNAVPQIDVELNLQRPGSGGVGYRPHFRVGTGEYLGVEIVSTRDGLARGSALATVRLVYWPQVNYGALSPGASFDVLEGPTVVGHGRVIEGQHAI